MMMMMFVYFDVASDLMKTYAKACILCEVVYTNPSQDGELAVVECASFDVVVGSHHSSWCDR
jgi:hypothetical protein